MRHIGNVPAEAQARTFEDYLLMLGINGKVEPEDGSWALWVFDEDRVEQARQEFRTFCEEPGNSRYRQATKAAEARRRAEQKKLTQFRRNQRNVRRVWNRAATPRKPVTAGLMALSILVAVLTTDFQQGPWKLCNRDGPLLRALYIAPVIHRDGKLYWNPSAGLAAVRRGEIYRLMTPIFLHFDILHLLFNMMWLRTLGASIELHRGSWRLLGMVVSIAVVSHLAQYWWSGPAFGGMSGVDFGLFGYIWMKSRYDPSSGFFMPAQMVFLMLAWMVLCYTGFMPIANAAHTVGLLAGMLLGLWGVLRRKIAGR